MKRPYLVIGGAILVVIVVIGIIFLNLGKAKENGTTAPGSKNSAITASPTPTPTTAPPATNANGQSEARREMPAECLDEDTAPEYCLSIIPPDAGPTVTSDQMSTESVASAFVTQWGQWRTAEPPAARTARLASLVDATSTGQSILTEQTKLSRPDTGLINLTGTAKATVLFAAFIRDDSGHWVYRVTTTYNASYTQGGTGTVSNFSGPATFTVTVDSGTKKVLTVSEEIPTLTGAP